MKAVPDKSHFFLTRVKICENMKAVPDKTRFFLTLVKTLEHNVVGKSKTPSNSRIDAIIKFQPPSNKQKVQECLGMLNLYFKYVYEMQLY